MRNLSATQQRILVWGLLLAAWQVFGMLAGSFYFASVTDTIGGLFQLIADGRLEYVLESMRQLVVGYGLALLVGVPAGVFIGSSLVGEATLGLYVRALFVTSLEALLPFLILLFGPGMQLRVAVVFIFSVLYVTINTAAGVRNVDPRLAETARAFGASRLQLARKVVVYSALPQIFAGLRLGWGFAIKGMVIAELWVATGTGKLLIDLGGNRRLDQYFAIALLIVTIGATGSWAIRRIQRLVTPWNTDTEGVRGLRGE